MVMQLQPSIYWLRTFSFVLFENFSYLKCPELLFCQIRFEQIPVCLVSCHDNNDHNDNDDNDKSLMITIVLHPLRCIQ